MWKDICSKSIRRMRNLRPQYLGNNMFVWSTGNFSIYGWLFVLLKWWKFYYLNSGWDKKIRFTNYLTAIVAIIPSVTLFFLPLRRKVFGGCWIRPDRALIYDTWAELCQSFATNRRYCLLENVEVNLSVISSFSWLISIWALLIWLHATCSSVNLSLAYKY